MSEETCFSCFRKREIEEMKKKSMIKQSPPSENPHLVNLFFQQFLIANNFKMLALRVNTNLHDEIFSQLRGQQIQSNHNQRRKSLRNGGLQNVTNIIYKLLKIQSKKIVKIRLNCCYHFSWPPQFHFVPKIRPKSGPDPVLGNTFKNNFYLRRNQNYECFFVLCLK